MWTNQGMTINANASDGFMLNLSAVLLRFCHPLSEKNKVIQLLKIGNRIVLQRFVKFRF